MFTQRRVFVRFSSDVAINPTGGLVCKKPGFRTREAI